MPSLRIEQLTTESAEIFVPFIDFLRDEITKKVQRDARNPLYFFDLTDEFNALHRDEFLRRHLLKEFARKVANELVDPQKAASRARTFILSKLYSVRDSHRELWGAALRGVDMAFTARIWPNAYAWIEELPPQSELGQDVRTYLAGRVREETHGKIMVEIGDNGRPKLNSPKNRFEDGPSVSA